MKLNRKPIQIAVGPQREDDEGRPVVHGCRLFALCDDGTIWYNDMTKNELDEWNWWEARCHSCRRAQWKTSPEIHPT
jgi:hypothetical protein